MRLDEIPQGGYVGFAIPRALEPVEGRLELADTFFQPTQRNLELPYRALRPGTVVAEPEGLVDVCPCSRETDAASPAAA